MNKGKRGIILSMHSKIKQAQKNEDNIVTAAQKYFAHAEKLRLEFKYEESVKNYLNSIIIDRNNYTS